MGNKTSSDSGQEEERQARWDRCGKFVETFRETFVDEDGKPHGDLTKLPELGKRTLEFTADRVAEVGEALCDAGEKVADGVSRVVDYVPVVGHVKGAFNDIALNDRKRAEESFEAANKTTGVLFAVGAVLAEAYVDDMQPDIHMPYGHPMSFQENESSSSDTSGES